MSSSPQKIKHSRHLCKKETAKKTHLFKQPLIQRWSSGDLSSLWLQVMDWPLVNNQWPQRSRVILFCRKRWCQGYDDRHMTAAANQWPQRFYWKYHSVMRLVMEQHVMAEATDWLQQSGWPLVSRVCATTLDRWWLKRVSNLLLLFEHIDFFWRGVGQSL